MSDRIVLNQFEVRDLAVERADNTSLQTIYFKFLRLCVMSKTGSL